MKASLLVPVALFVLVGCGGGGASDNAGAQDPAAEFAFGSLRGRAAATNPPLTSSSEHVTATALKGTITALSLQDQQAATDELRIVFSSPLGSITNHLHELYSCKLDGSDLVRITNTPGAEESPAVSPEGKRIAFSAQGAGGDFEIFVMNLDGTGRVQITNDGINDRGPKWHPAGNNLVYFNDQGDLLSVNVNTKVVTPLVVDAFDNRWPEYSSDGQNVWFGSVNRESDAKSHIYGVPSIGGAVTNVFFSLDDQQFLRQSPNGLFVSFYNEAQNRQRLLTIGGVTVPGATALTGVGWSPDSSKIVWSALTARLFYSNPDGSGAVEVLPATAVEKMFPTFVPAPKEVKFVGPGSLFGSRLAGMIFSQSGDAVRGLLGFDADTPSTAVLTKQTPDETDAPNIVFSIDADSVREISYAHAPYWKPSKVVGSGTSVPSAAGALVSLNSVTGKVVAVLPFSGSRTAGKPMFRDQGNTRIFSGTFLGAFDKSGKNVSGGAVSEVRLNMQTGELE